jgi:hypothetical protein
MVLELQNDLLYNEGIKEIIFKDLVGMCINKHLEKL